MDGGARASTRSGSPSTTSSTTAWRWTRRASPPPRPRARAGCASGWPRPSCPSITRCGWPSRWRSSTSSPRAGSTSGVGRGNRPAEFTRLPRAPAGEPRALRRGRGHHAQGVDRGALLPRGPLLHDRRGPRDPEALAEAAPAHLPGLRQRRRHRELGGARLAHAELPAHRPGGPARQAARQLPHRAAQARAHRGRDRHAHEGLGRVAPDLRGGHRRAGPGRGQGRRDVVPGLAAALPGARAHRGRAPESPARASGPRPSASRR